MEKWKSRLRRFVWLMTAFIAITVLIATAVLRLYVNTPVYIDSKYEDVIVVRNDSPIDQRGITLFAWGDLCKLTGGLSHFIKYMPEDDYKNVLLVHKAHVYRNYYKNTCPNGVIYTLSVKEFHERLYMQNGGENASAFRRGSRQRQQKPN